MGKQKKNKQTNTFLLNWKPRTSDLFLQISLPLQTIYTQHYLVTTQAKSDYEKELFACFGWKLFELSFK